MDDGTLLSRPPSLVSHSSIPVVLLPVGKIQPNVFANYVNVFRLFTHVPMYDLAQPGDYSKDSWSMPRFSWQAGGVRFEYIIPPAGIRWPVMWSQFQAHLLPMCVIGILHCPSSPDIAAAHAQFSSMASQYSSACFQACFAFDPLDEHWSNPALIDLQTRGHLVMFPNDRQTEDGNSIVRMHLEHLVGNMAVVVIKHCEAKIKAIAAAESSTASLASLSLATGHDASNPDFERDRNRKKRVQGRVRKVMGDYCLLAGSPQDALEHYMIAQTTCKSINDTLWQAGAVEGMAAALRSADDFKQPGALGRPAFSSDIHDRLVEACTLFENCKAPSFQVACSMKLAKYLSIATPLYANNMTELLWKCQTIQVEHSPTKAILLVDMAAMYDRLRMRRKVGMMLWQACEKLMTQSLYNGALQLLLFTCNVLRLPVTLEGVQAICNGIDGSERDTRRCHAWLLQRMSLMLSLARCAFQVRAGRVFIAAVVALLRLCVLLESGKPMTQWDSYRGLLGSTLLRVRAFTAEWALGVGQIRFDDTSTTPDSTEQLFSCLAWRVWQFNLATAEDNDALTVIGWRSFAPLFDDTLSMSEAAMQASGSFASQDVVLDTSLRPASAGSVNLVPNQLQNKLIVCLHKAAEHTNWKSASTMDLNGLVQCAAIKPASLDAPVRRFTSNSSPTNAHGGGQFFPFVTAQPGIEAAEEEVKPPEIWDEADAHRVTVHLHNSLSVPLTIQVESLLISDGGASRAIDLVEPVSAELPPRANIELAVRPSVLPLGIWELTGVGIVYSSVRSRLMVSTNTGQRATFVEIVSGVPRLALEHTHMVGQAVVSGQTATLEFALMHVGGPAAQHVVVRAVLERPPADAAVMLYPPRQTRAGPIPLLSPPPLAWIEPDALATLQAGVPLAHGSSVMVQVKVRTELGLRNIRVEIASRIEGEVGFERFAAVQLPVVVVPGPRCLQLRPSHSLPPWASSDMRWQDHLCVPLDCALENQLVSTDDVASVVPWIQGPTNVPRLLRPSSSLGDVLWFMRAPWPPAEEESLIGPAERHSLMRSRLRLAFTLPDGRSGWFEATREAVASGVETIVGAAPVAVSASPAEGPLDQTADVGHVVPLNVRVCSQRHSSSSVSVRVHAFAATKTADGNWIAASKACVSGVAVLGAIGRHVTLDGNAQEAWQVDLIGVQAGDYLIAAVAEDLETGTCWTQHNAVVLHVHA